MHRDLLLHNQDLQLLGVAHLVVAQQVVDIKNLIMLGKLFSGGAAELVKGVGGVIDNLHTSK